MARVFGKRETLSVSATKSMTGHLLGAAGAIEAILSIMSVYENKIPPTINTNETDSDYASYFDLTLGKLQNKTVNFAMSNTFGFGGHISTTIFKKFNN